MPMAAALLLLRSALPHLLSLFQFIEGTILRPAYGQDGRTESLRYLPHSVPAAEDGAAGPIARAALRRTDSSAVTTAPILAVVHLLPMDSAHPCGATWGPERIERFELTSEQSDSSFNLVNATWTSSRTNPSP